MTISLIAALSKNNVIGIDGKLPWHLSDDLKNFKRLTLGKPVIMGRKTFESIGCKPLPERANIVISRDQNYTLPNVIVCRNIDDAIKMAGQYGEEIMVIGGGQIYEEALPYADKMYLTIIDTIIPHGDAYFPKWNEADWRIIEEVFFSHNAKNQYDFVVRTYVRKIE